PRRGDRLLGHLRDHPAQGRGAGQRTACRGRGGASQDRIRARFNGVPGAASGLEATGGELLISYEAWQLWLRTQHPALSAGASIDGNLTHFRRVAHACTRRRRRPDIIGRDGAKHDGERARRVPPQAVTRATTRRARPEPGWRQEQPGRSQPIRRRLRTLGRPLRARRPYRLPRGARRSRTAPCILLPRWVAKAPPSDFACSAMIADRQRTLGRPLPPARLRRTLDLLRRTSELARTNAGYAYVYAVALNSGRCVRTGNGTAQ